MLGLLSGLEELARDALLLIPIVSDSTRKLTYPSLGAIHEKSSV